MYIGIAFSISTVVHLNITTRTGEPPGARTKFIVFG